MDDPEQVLALAKVALPPSPTLTHPAWPKGLTPHGLEVLRLQVQGLTNTQIAEQVVASLLAVHIHLGSMYSKLGVTLVQRGHALCPEPLSRLTCLISLLHLE